MTIGEFLSSVQTQGRIQIKSVSENFFMRETRIEYDSARCTDLPWDVCMKPVRSVYADDNSLVLTYKAV